MWIEEQKLVSCVLSSYLRAQHGDVENGDDCVLYGPSTENKIERWWRELSHRMEGYFKGQLKSLLEDGHYDPSNEIDRYTFQTGMLLIY